MKSQRTDQSLPLLPQIERLHRRLSVWRDRRRRGQRIPEELWQAAAALARVHGVSPVASALRLNYSDLQRRARWTAGPGRASAPASFVEVPIARLVPALGSPTVIEWAHPSGSRLTLRVQNTAELLAVVQSMLRP